MPKDCRECRLIEYHSNLGETWCAPTVGLLAVNYKPIPFDGRPNWCPLVELPEKHGDLIDRDALRKDYKMNDDCDTCVRDVRKCEYDRNYILMDFCSWLDNEPVVIEAEGER